MFVHSLHQAARKGLAAGFVVAVLIGLAAPASAAAPGPKAGDFIRALASDAVGSLADKDMPQDKRIQRFRKLFNDHFAIRTIGRFVLGRSWRKASKAEQKEYLGLFEDLMVVSYVDRFASYAGNNIEVIRTRDEKGQSTTVFSKIMRPTGKPANVIWRVGSRGKVMKILDVIVEGVSMSQTLRSEFSSSIRSNGGKVSGLIAVLRKKTTSLK